MVTQMSVAPIREACEVEDRCDLIARGNLDERKGSPLARNAVKRASEEEREQVPGAADAYLGRISGCVSEWILRTGLIVTQAVTLLSALGAKRDFSPQVRVQKNNWHIVI